MNETLARSIRRATFAARCAVAHVGMTDGPLGAILAALEAYADSDADELPGAESIMRSVCREIAKSRSDWSPAGSRLRGARYATLRAVQAALEDAPWGVGEQTAEDAAVSATIRVLTSDDPWGGSPELRAFFAAA